MAGFIRSLVRNFSSLRTTMRSNIVSGPRSIGSGGRMSSGSTFSAFTSTRYLSNWLSKVVELKEYEITELASTAVSVFYDYLYNYFNETEDIITLSDNIPDYKIRTDKINTVIKQLGLVNLTKDHLNEIRYYGSFCIKIDWDEKSRKWKQSSLLDPYSVITIQSNNKAELHLVPTADNRLSHEPANSILRIGKNNFRLINDCIDIKSEDGKVLYSSILGDNDSILSGAEFTSGYPLFYNLLGKIKEYLLKDQLVSLLSIKDLIQPLLLLIRVDKTTDPTEANRLAITTENLINKYSDLSSILSASFSINDLLDSVLNNIRVLPDYQSTIGDMNSVDLSKISQKINDIKSDQDKLKEDIHTSLGIPRALTAGDTNKWEAIKSSQRLNSNISSFMKSISDSYKTIVITIYELLFKEDLDEGDISVNLFKKTDIDYNDELNSAEVSNSFIEAINRILDTAQQFLQNNKLVDKKNYLIKIKQQIRVIDPTWSELITDELIDSFIKELDESE